jgi:hypothetical protein
MQAHPVSADDEQMKSLIELQGKRNAVIVTSFHDGSR